MVNPIVLKWLKEGKFYEALMGKHGYFMGDYTYRGHDLLLIISTMFELAKDEHEMVSRKFDKALRKICEENILIFLDAIDAYLIIKKDIKKTFSIKLDDYAELLLHTEIDSNKYSDDEKRQMSCLLAAIKKEVPEFDIVLPWQV